MVALKRLDVIVEALRLIDFPVEWTHLGDGPTREAVQEAASNLPDRIRCSFPGRLANREVRRWYREHPVDVFVNMSETEGAPVAVMEALSAGIPVVATDVGGTAELVDDSVGILLARDAGPRELAGALRLLQEDQDRRLTCAGKARERWRKRFDADRNFSAFADFLSEEVFHERARNRKLKAEAPRGVPPASS
jgi:glycosyltransferase involved in cell wall biosynthesis